MGKRTEYPVRTIAAVQEITMEALDLSEIDLRELVRNDLIRLLEENRRGGWVSEIEFDEQEVSRWVPIYADDADFDDPELEPVDWEAVPVLVIRAKRRCIDPNG